MLASMQLLSAKTWPVLLLNQAFQAGVAFPPVAWGDVSGWIVKPLFGVPPEFDLEIWSNATVNLTGAELYGGSLHPITVADDTFAVSAHDSLDLSGPSSNIDTIIAAVEAGDSEVTFATVADGVGVGTLDESAYPAVVFHYQHNVTTVANLEAAITAGTRLTVATPGTGATVLQAPGDTFAATALTGGVEGSVDANAHGLLTGDGPFRLSSDDTLPAGLEAGIDYWVVRLGANALAFAASLSDAMAGTVVEITDDGAGTHTLSDIAATADTPGTQRLHWHSEGLLGVAGDGAIALTNQKAYRERRQHRPRALFYALMATMSATDPEWLSAAVYPVQECA